MNKDIQTLIEREAEKHISQFNSFEYKEYEDLISWGYEGQRVSNDANQLRDRAFRNGVNMGAEIALFLFKWRKVSEEPIPIEQIVVLRSGDNYTVIIISDEEIAKYAQGKFKDYEWMPIP